MSPPDLMTLVLAELKEIRRDLGDIKVVQGKHHESLQAHMRRTEIAEEVLEDHRARFQPLEAHVSAWSGVGKALTIASLIGGLALAAWKMWGGG